ncbi:5554_t:CDS:10 [Dentiscutata erythropus]|uniref:5554_t:CDS:1 n=1 Tax=Dentiscutata erythropus TaxID=1348616 RepID=A0A9N9GBU2_9GLOM|nr:5554_t:CDS:10 [Dentiscutata erythropus]
MEFKETTFDNNTEYLLVLVLFFPASYPTLQSTSVENLTYGFGQTNVSGGPVGVNTSILSEIVQVVKENSVQYNYFLVETNSYLGSLPNPVATYIQNNPTTQAMTEKQVQECCPNDPGVKEAQEKYWRKRDNCLDRNTSQLYGPTSVDLVIPVTSTRTKTIKIRLEGFLDKGTSAKVYKINWNGSPAAIKIPSDVNNLKHEAEMLRGLKKRNFTNAQHCKELLKLLKHIHSYGLYHRDVLPSNIMLDTENNSLCLLIGVEIHTNNNGMLYKGTTTYASPSILDNDIESYIPKPADDLHSFAIKDYWHNELNGHALWKEMLDANKGLCDVRIAYILRSKRQF